MEIRRQPKSAEKKAEIRVELAKVSDPPARTGRVCDPSCNTVCSTCGAMDCACGCSRTCPDIGAVLTTDPKFPIENKIAPLAFELKRLDVFQPCWSCEGHNDNTGRLWKIPRVWFYCDSVVHVRLLSDVLKSLEIKALISVPWQVRVTHSDEGNPSTTFSLEPAMGKDSNTTLPSLQDDAMAIAEHLNEMMVDRAGALIASS